MQVHELVGSGDRIALWMLPFVVVGVALNVAFPEVFTVGGPPDALRIVSITVLVPGVVIWLWSAFLILTKVPRHELITRGPYAVMKHPIYTSVALLVLPWAGFLLDTWLGAALGILLYVASRIEVPAEEEAMARAFGPAWDAYASRVRLGWL
jgi:protein-S-isoprenylcysteine O-methyltransferase Ste14